MKKRILSVMLLSALMLSQISCGSEQNVDEDTSIVSDSTTVSENVNKPSFAEEDNNGETFSVYAPGSQPFYANYFFADEQTGDAMNDAIYRREQLVEDYLGINIEHIITGEIFDVMPTLQKISMSGDDTYQLYLTHTYAHVATMITEDLLYDLKDLEYCNFENDYWRKAQMDSLSVNGHYFYGLSDYMLPNLTCFIFSKDMVEDNSLEDPYKLVKEGKWTIDKLSQMASQVTNDINGDGQMDINDQYGIGAPDDYFRLSFLYAAGLTLVEQTNDGFELTINNERMFGLVEKIDNLVNKSGDVYLYSYLAEANDQLTVASVRTLFRLAKVGMLTELRDSSVEYGILPYPKYDEEQDGYHTNDRSGLMCIPKTVGNPELCGKAVELLAYYSNDTVVKAYYDITLDGKLSRDEESKEMLDILFDGVVYDVGLNYIGANSGNGLGRLLYTIPYLVVKEKSGDFASYYAKYEGEAKLVLEEFTESAPK